MVESFDTASDTWSKVVAMNSERAEFAAAVFGGADEDSAELATVERLDPRQGKWVDVAPMASRRSGHCVVATTDALYALGGYNGDKIVATVERLDPRTGTWNEVAPMDTCRKDFA